MADEEQTTPENTNPAPGTGENFDPAAEQPAATPGSVEEQLAAAGPDASENQVAEAPAEEPAAEQSADTPGSVEEQLAAAGPDASENQVAEAPAEEPAADPAPEEPAADPAPSEPEAPSVGDSVEVKEAELNAREAALQEREDAAAATLAKAEAVAAQVEKTVADAEKRVSQAGKSEDLTKKNNDEKVAIVTVLLEKAYGTEDVGEVVSYVPRATLTNNSNAGQITFEKGIKYQVPEAVVEDLLRREAEYLDYQEKTHIREEITLNAGTISGGGK